MSKITDTKSGGDVPEPLEDMDAWLTPASEDVIEDERVMRLSTMNIEPTPDAADVVQMACFGCAGSFIFCQMTPHGDGWHLRVLVRGMPPTRDTTKALRGPTGGRLFDRIEAGGFWQLPADMRVFGLDGENWFLFVKQGGRKHTVKRWSPDPSDPFTRACSHVLKLARVNPGDILMGP